MLKFVLIWTRLVLQIAGATTHFNCILVLVLFNTWAITRGLYVQMRLFKILWKMRERATSFMKAKRVELEAWRTKSLPTPPSFYPFLLCFKGTFRTKQVDSWFGQSSRLIFCFSFLSWVWSNFRCFKLLFFVSLMYN